MFLRKARSRKFSEFLVQLSLKAFQVESFNPLMIINYDDRLSGDKLQNSQQTRVNYKMQHFSFSRLTLSSNVPELTEQKYLLSGLECELFSEL